MPPKKDKKVEEPVLSTLYAKREPLPAQEPPNDDDCGLAWKEVRNAFVLPMPEWNSNAVDTTEWNPSEQETFFTSKDFSGKCLAKAVGSSVTAWKRAGVATDASAPEVSEPVAEIVEEEEEKEAVPDPKAKAKADPKAKAKSKGKEEAADPGAKPTTEQQFADVSYDGSACVVTKEEFRSREFHLVVDECSSPICQEIVSAFAVIQEHRDLIADKCFLWDHIFPQDKDGRPIYNPHGKYIVRLFLMGKWRQVQIDDVVPVGNTLHNAYSHAPVLPANANPLMIWPQLLSKALLRAFQTDLKVGRVPCIMALTGWLPYDLPLSWDALGNSHGTRPLNCLNLTTMLETLETRQRDQMMASTQPEEAPRGRKAAGGSTSAVPALNLEGKVAQGPPLKLVGQPTEAALPFLVCELEAEPPQVRLKSATWRPVNGQAMKTVFKDTESDAEDAEEETVPQPETDQQESEPDQEEQDEDEEERRSQRSPSGGEPGQQSARSKEEGEQGNGDAPADGPDGDEDAVSEAWMSPWPVDLPALPMLNSVMQEHHATLLGGWWLPYEELAGSCKTFTTFMPPAKKVLSACLDLTWSDRKNPYELSPARLVRIRLKPEAAKNDNATVSNTLSTLTGGEKEKPPQGKPWHRAVIVYEPLRVDPNFTGGKETTDSLGSSTSGLLLQSVSNLLPTVAEQAAPEYIHLAAGDDPINSVATRSLLLPPGEHWYLIFDDASKAGSVLSMYVEGAQLNMAESMIDFVEPAAGLTQKGIPVVTLEPSEYPAQTGFSVWAKAEVALSEEVTSTTDCMHLHSFVSDPELRPFLQITFLKLTLQEDVGAEERCANWSVETLVRAPLLRLISLPLRQPTPGKTTKYIVMLEASVTTPVARGKLCLQLMLPHLHRKTLPPVEDLVQVTSLKPDVVMRWNDKTEENDKRLVLCERLTVPAGAGDVTAMLRVAVSRLPGAWLSATLVAQLPPLEENRPKTADGGDPEPLAPGLPIEPREYGGRHNWLSRCVATASAEGPEVAIFPHVSLCEGATYILYVKLDPFKGPTTLLSGDPEDPATWLLEMFGSGEIEAGRDTMEEDLEVLVRKSWEVPDQDPAQPTRQEKAAAARERYLSSLSAGDAKEEGETAADAVDVDDAKQRACAKPHTNFAIRDFVHWHTEVEPTLAVEGPYVVAPDPPLHPAEEKALELTAAQEAAQLALGMAGAQGVRREAVENAAEKWDQILRDMEASKKQNVDKIAELEVWEESQSEYKVPFREQREALLQGYQKRLEAQAALKALVKDEDVVDPAVLQGPLAEAKDAGVAIWDGRLIDSAVLKVDFLAAVAALSAAMKEMEGDAAESAKSALANAAEAAQKLLGKMQTEKLGVSADLGVDDLLAQSAELLKEPEVETEAADAA